MIPQTKPDLILDSHDERILRLEDTVSDMATQVATHGVKLDYLGRAIEESAQMLADKIDACTDPIVKATTEISKLKTEKAANKAKWALWKKIGTVLILTITGAFGHSIFDFLSKIR